MEREFLLLRTPIPIAGPIMNSMKKSDSAGHRRFHKTVGLAAGGAVQVKALQAPARKHSYANR